MSVAAMAAALANSASALAINVDTDAGAINGVGSGGQFNGTTFTTRVVEGVMQFLVQGDFDVDAGDTVNGTGNRGASFFAGNNADIGAGVTFDVNASGTSAGAGAGNGGNAADSGPNGGSGGGGGQRQAGGNGGAGGQGGGGAGGTVKLFGSVVDAAGASANTSGGSGGSQGESGRLIVGSNVAGGGPVGVGASAESYDGPRGDNPFILGVDSTAFIADLVGGADMFGLLGKGVDANAAEFASVRANAPVDALGALLRLDLGPARYGDDYVGFDMLLFINLMAVDLIDPMLGVDPFSSDPNFLVALLEGGFANDPLFGGAGPQALGSLGGLGVYATLISEVGTTFNASVRGAVRVRGVSLADGEYEYLVARADVPTPGTLALLGLGLGWLGIVARRRRSA